MAKFKMTFSGLCAFAAVKDVNESDIDVRDDASEVVVFLVNSNHKDVTTLLRREKRTHSPLLGFEWKIAAAGKGDTGVRGSWELFGEVVRLEIRRKDGQERPPQRVVLKGGDIKAPHSVPQGEEEEENIWWIPRMADVLPEADVLRDDAFDFPPSEPKEEVDAKWPVVARIHLSGGGSLGTTETGKYKGSRVLASFVPGPPPDADPLTQVIAHEAEFVIDIGPEEVLILEATNEGNPENQLNPGVRSFEFPGDSQDKHEVNVSNLCFYYRDGQFPSEDPPTEDDDFTYFYLLSDKFGEFGTLPKDYTKLPTPVPVRYEIRVHPPPPPSEPNRVGGGADPIRCTMTRLSPVSKEEFELQAESFAAPRDAKDSLPIPGALGPLTDVTALMQNPPTTATVHMERDDIGFAMKDQDRDFWCWAAVAQYVRFVQDDISEELCALAGGILKSNGIDGGEIKCCKKGACNRTFDLDLALKHRDNLSGEPKHDKLKFTEVQEQIEGHNPIACGLSRSDKSKHAVVIRGWGKIKGKDRLLIADPDGPRPRMWPVSDLKKAEECGWDFTCLTKKGGK